MTAGEKVVQTRRLCVGYSNVAVASGLDLDLRGGEIVALLGRNGAGKTTTLHTLAGLLPPVSGEILFSGGLPPRAFHQRVRRGLGLLTERRAVIRRLTVLENLRLFRGGTPEIAFNFFPELFPLRNRRVGLLSGGEQQMLAFGKLMVQHPSLLLIDELSLGLAPLIVERLLKAVQTAAKESVGILLVEQQPATALTIADRAYVLAGGAIGMSGSARELASRLDELEDLYLTR